MVREGGAGGCLLCGPEVDREAPGAYWGFQSLSVPMCHTGMTVVPASWAGWGLTVPMHAQCLE